MNRKNSIRKVIAIVIVFAIAFGFAPFFDSTLRKVSAADEKHFYTVSYDSIFSNHGYKDGDGKIAYCANQNLAGPGTDGTKYYQISSNHSYDYLMYHGYPNTNTINGVEWSDNKARDITQYAAWLLELGHSYNRDSQSEAWNEAADELFKGAAAYKGGGAEDGASSLWKTDVSGKQMIIQPNPKGDIKLKKVSADPNISDGNKCYSLKGAVYGVYSDEGCSKKIGELRTDETGGSDTINVPAGRYWVREITAPKGFDLEEESYPVAVKGGKTVTVSVKDVPRKEVVSIQLKNIYKDT